jgi:non-ribosomal peptide synthetase component F
MAEHFQVLLEGLVADPNALISTVPFLPPDERRDLDGFNATAEPIPGLCVHELVDAQAARTPDAPAVGDLSYRDLIATACAVQSGSAGSQPPIGWPIANV